MALPSPPKLQTDSRPALLPRLVSILAIWLVLLGTYLVSRPSYWADPAHHDELLYAALATVCGAALSSAMLWIFRPLKHDAPVSRRLVVLVASAGMLTLAHAALDVPLQIAVTSPRAPDGLSMLFENAAFYLWAHGAAGALLMLLDLGDARRSHEKALAEAAVRSARRAASVLRLQIRPHFLFNALNGASALALTERPAEADKVLGALANLLRLSLQGDPDATSTLGEELEMAGCYVAIEEIRFAGRLSVSVQVPDRLMSAPVPCMLMLPIVERVVSYALEGRGKAEVQIRASAEGEELAVQVASNRPGAPLEGASVDLLEEIGGAPGEVRLEQTAEAGYGLTLRLPLVLSERSRKSGKRKPADANANVLAV